MEIGSMFAQPYLERLKGGLDAYAMRHKVVADNIANVDSQGYRSQRVDFEDSLARAASGQRIGGLRTDDAHLPLGQAGPRPTPEVVDVAEGYDNGLNDVNVEREMGELAKNDLSYRLATRLLNRKYGELRMAITGQPNR